LKQEYETVKLLLAGNDSLLKEVTTQNQQPKALKHSLMGNGKRNQRNIARPFNRIGYPSLMAGTVT
jgi:hypothetical protein